MVERQTVRESVPECVAEHMRQGQSFSHLLELFKFSSGEFPGQILDTEGQAVLQCTQCREANSIRHVHLIDRSGTASQAQPDKHWQNTAPLINLQNKPCTQFDRIQAEKQYIQREAINTKR